MLYTCLTDIHTRLGYTFTAGNWAETEAETGAGAGAGSGTDGRGNCAKNNMNCAKCRDRQGTHTHWHTHSETIRTKICKISSDEKTRKRNAEIVGRGENVWEEGRREKGVMKREEGKGSREERAWISEMRSSCRIAVSFEFQMQPKDSKRTMEQSDTGQWAT